LAKFVDYLDLVINLRIYTLLRDSENYEIG